MEGIRLEIKFLRELAVRIDFGRSACWWVCYYSLQVDDEDIWSTGEYLSLGHRDLLTTIIAFIVIYGFSLNVIFDGLMYVFNVEDIQLKTHELLLSVFNFLTVMTDHLICFCEFKSVLQQELSRFFWHMFFNFILKVHQKFIWIFLSRVRGWSSRSRFFIIRLVCETQWLSVIHRFFRAF